FLHDQLYDAGARHLRRSYLGGPSTVDGFLEDYAYAIRGLVDLYESAGDIAWLKFALELQSIQDQSFGDEKVGGYFLTPAGDATLLLRQKNEDDGAEPAGNAIACRNLLRLARLTDDKALEERAASALRFFSDRTARFPTRSAAMLVAL